MRSKLIKSGWLLLLTSVIWQSVSALEVQQQVVTRADWPQYANGVNLAALPQTRHILRQFDETGKMQITIRYPGGEPGIEWGKQMLRWFVAYGVPHQYLRLELGSGAPDQLVLVLIDRSQGI